MAIVAVAAAVIATAISTYMSVRSTQQQAALARSVQQQKEEERRAAIEQAAFDEKQNRRKNALLMAKQEAIFAASGYDTTEGTPLFTSIDSAKQAELDALNIRGAGGRQAAGLKFESNIARFRSQAAEGAIPLIIAQGVAEATSSGYTTYKRATARRPSVVSDWSD